MSYILFFTFEKELPDDAFEDDVYDDTLVGCAAKVITWCNIQDENGFSNEIPFNENLQEFFKCTFGCPNGTSDLDFVN